MWARAHRHSLILVGPQDLSTLTEAAFYQVASALGTNLGVPRVAGLTIRTVDIWTCFDTGHDSIILNKFGPFDLNKLDVIRLRCTALGTDFFRTRVECLAIRAGPLQFGVS
jgi:hypothetical protein